MQGERAQKGTVVGYKMEVSGEVHAALSESH